MKYLASLAVFAFLLAFLTVIFADNAPTAPDAKPPAATEKPADQPPPATPEKPKAEPLLPPRITFKCVDYHSMTTKIPLPTNNAMTGCIDKEGNLYIACQSVKSGKVTVPGGLVVITAKGHSYTYNASSKPPLPSDSVEHVWQDDAGLLYVSTSAGLAIIDTKSTPEDPSDDTVTVYSLMGVTDITKGLKDAKPSSFSPALGSDNAVYSWMDPDTRDLLVCCGGPSTWRGCLTVLVYDKGEKTWTKSYSYRSINFLLERSEHKMWQKGVWDTTQCWDPDKGPQGLMIGGKRIKKLDIGENQFCWRAFRDNDSGLIYLARRDTYDSDIQAIPGFNRDGGLTIIDTKKNADPSDDEVIAILSQTTSPTLASTNVMDMRFEKAAGDIYIATVDIESGLPNRVGGLTIIHKDKTAQTYTETGFYDTSSNDTRKLLDNKKALHSSFVLHSLRDEASGDIFVFEDQAIDVIHKDGFISRVPLKLFKDLPVAPANGILWAEYAWLDDKGQIHVCTGDLGTIGVITLKIAPYEKPKEPEKPKTP
jgi:hypothetical protein